MGDDRTRAEQTARLLREAAALAGMVITGDARVSEADAARLLGLANGTLRNLRAEGKGPRRYAIGFAGCRVSYRVDDLAEWIESTLEKAT
jgi:hypothetical protein